jgi:hypothetical protein
MGYFSVYEIGDRDEEGVGGAKDREKGPVRDGTHEGALGVVEVGGCV